MVIREDISIQSNFRATDNLQNWLKKNKLVGISGVDTRQITQILRERGSVNAIIEYNKNGNIEKQNIKLAVPTVVLVRIPWSGVKKKKHLAKKKKTSIKNCLS